jgi:hypothetical protein
MMLLTLHITILALLGFTATKQYQLNNQQQYHLAETLDYNNVFNKKSDTSLVVLACGGIKKL